MKTNYLKRSFCLSAALLLVSVGFGIAQTTGIEKRNVRSHMEFLASDAMQGRGSGTIYELIAGKYLGSQMRQFGIEPAGDKLKSGKKSFIQTVEIRRETFAKNPILTYTAGGKTKKLTHSKEMLIVRTDGAKAEGGLHKIYAGENSKPGAVAFVRIKDGDNPQNLAQSIGNLFGSGVAAIVVEETPEWRARWGRMAARKVRFSKFGGSSAPLSPMLLIVSKAEADELAKVSDGTKIEIGGKLAESEVTRTWNSVGMIKGSDPKLSSEVVLLSAHMDHIGVRENAPGDDKIFNGADDDASGCVAVLEIARKLAEGKRPKRTVYFAFFGSEESGGFGSKFFVDNLPVAKEKLIANLQFEMLGRPDPKVGKNELWLTGYERSNLGSELAKQGAKLVKDPRPEQNFFRRSDNYTLARQGIVAHTVSSFGLHKDYHRASDEIETIDFDYMTNAINSMVKPIDWLINSDFAPTWHKGMKP